MNAVILILLQAALFGAQVPLPPVPDLPIPAGPARQPALPIPPPLQVEPARNLQDLTPPAPQDTIKPPALVPASSTSQGAMAPPSDDGPKPPPFRLIEANSSPAPYPQPLYPAGKGVGGEGPAPMPTPELLPAGVVAAPVLLLSRTGPVSVKAGESFCYEIVAKNAGSVAAAQVKLEEQLPPGTKFVSAQPTAVAEDNHLAWTGLNLGPGDQQCFKVEVEPSHDGEWKATATLTVSVSSTMKASVAGAVKQPLLTMTGPGTVPVGHPVVFQIHVTNNTGAPLTDAVLRVLMTPGLQHVHGEAIEASLGDLAPAQTKELKLEAVTVQTGRLTADATLLSGKNAVATAHVAMLATEQPTLALRQTGPLSPPVGGVHEFKLDVINRSHAELHNVEVSDVLPEGLQFSGGDGRAQYDPGTRTVRWNVGTLAPGQVRQLVFRAQVRGAGAQVNRISARAAGVAEAQLHSILRLGGAR